MELLTYATFDADFPEDAELAESDDLEHPGGRTIAQVLCEMLRGCGLKVSEPEQHSFYGWAFIASDDEFAFWFLLQFPGPWLLLSQDKTSLFRRLFSPKSLSRHRRMLEMLNDAMAHDVRFRNLQWFSKQQFENCGDRPRREKAP
jgi:hypothetical protein